MITSYQILPKKWRNIGICKIFKVYYNKTNIMAGQMKTANSFPVVVTNPTRYTGGKNTYPIVVTNPTRYTGGLNIAACDVPNGKLKK